MLSILILGPDKSNCFQRHLKKLNGQQIDHKIFLKFLDMISLAMNYHLVNKLIYIFYLLCNFYVIAKQSKNGHDHRALLTDLLK